MPVPAIDPRGLAKVYRWVGIDLMESLRLYADAESAWNAINDLLAMPPEEIDALAEALPGSTHTEGT